MCVRACIGRVKGEWEERVMVDVGGDQRWAFWKTTRAESMGRSCREVMRLDWPIEGKYAGEASK
jgi:hypothetical protein